MASSQPHIVLVPFPAQGHITPMLKLAKLLHSRGFHITFVNTEFNHNRLIRARGPSAVEGLPDFRFETIPDSLPPSDLDATQDIPSLCFVIAHNFLTPFKNLVTRLSNPSSGVPPVTSIIGDGVMTFTVAAGEELGIPVIVFQTTSAIAYFAFLHYQTLIDHRVIPLKDAGDLTNGYLDNPVDWISGLSSMRLRDFPDWIRTTDPDDFMLNHLSRDAQRTRKARAIILNTFDELERSTLEALSSLVPPIYTLGPLSLLSLQISLKTVHPSLWKEDPNCIDWLQRKPLNSVVYVNFGSITNLSSDQLLEFAWGLANSNYNFLWVMRPDLVKSCDAAALLKEFMRATEGRMMMVGWCSQEEVLEHPAIGLFLTHSGWNSTLDSISAGVPMLCWPYMADQLTNCRYACAEWRNGMEIDNNVEREKVEILIKEAMDGPEGMEMRRRALEWKERAVRATESGGSSSVNFERLVEIIKRM